MEESVCDRISDLATSMEASLPLSTLPRLNTLASIFAWSS